MSFTFKDFLISCLLASTLFFAFFSYRQNQKLEERSEFVRALLVENNNLQKNISECRDTIEVLTSEDYYWLNRALYSETDRVEEMKYVGWTIRNRVREHFKGDSTYKSVILHPRQFSAFNRNRRSRYQYIYMDLTHAEDKKRWIAARSVSLRILLADSAKNPIPTVTHFWSEVSRASDYPPRWTREKKKVSIEGINPIRFRFYESTFPV